MYSLNDKIEKIVEISLEDALNNLSVLKTIEAKALLKAFTGIFFENARAYDLNTVNPSEGSAVGEVKATFITAKDKDGKIATFFWVLKFGFGFLPGCVWIGIAPVELYELCGAEDLAVIEINSRDQRERLRWYELYESRNEFADAWNRDILEVYPGLETTEPCPELQKALERAKEIARPEQEKEVQAHWPTNLLGKLKSIVS